LEEIQDGIFNPPCGTGYGFAVYEKVQILRFYGDYLKQTPKEYLEKWAKEDQEFQTRMNTSMQSIKTREDALKILQTQRETQKWLGIFLFPPVRIGSRSVAHGKRADVEIDNGF
jgi:hypothetical protein